MRLRPVDVGDGQDDSPAIRPGSRAAAGIEPRCYTLADWLLIVYRNSARHDREAPSACQRTACRHRGRDQRPHGGRRGHRAHRAGRGAAPADAASGAPGDRSPRDVGRPVPFDQPPGADAYEHPQRARRLRHVRSESERDRERTTGERRPDARGGARRGGQFCCRRRLPEHHVPASARGDPRAPRCPAARRRVSGAARGGGAAGRP